MDAKTIKKLIANGEDVNVEFKESFNRETIETVAAFANTKGGNVLIGVTDNGVLKGVLIGKETLKKWVNEISQALEPALIPEIEKRASKSSFAGENPLREIQRGNNCH